MNKQKIEVAISVARMLCWACRLAKAAIDLAEVLNNFPPF